MEGDGKVSGYALITPVYLEIALFSGARSGAQAIGQVISAIDIADISIRTLRKEGDAHIAVHPVVPDVISIHALHEEGDPVWLPHAVQLPIFLSTPSARRATERKQSTALREEGDPSWKPSTPRARRFLSTPSARRATYRVL